MCGKHSTPPPINFYWSVRVVGKAKQVLVMFVFHNGDVVGGVRAGDHKLIAYLLFLIFFTAVRILFTAMQDFW